MADVPPPAALAVLSELKAKPIQRIDVSEVAVMKTIKAEEPVIILNSFLVDSAVDRWSLEYLRDNVGDTNDFSVRSSNTTFLYADEEKSSGAGYEFKYSVKVQSSKIKPFYDDFVGRIRASGREPFQSTRPGVAPPPIPEGETSLLQLLYSAGQPLPHDVTTGKVPLHTLLPKGAEAAPAKAEATGSKKPAVEHPFPSAATNFGSPAEMLYLQQTLYAGLGPRVVADFNAFNWPLLEVMVRRAGWGNLESNLLLVGHKGAITPIHYDEMQNLFAQVRGRKLIIMASPGQFPNLYPHPLGHPADRQSRVDIRWPDTTSFPNFSKATFMYTVLQPGEVLYIPAYWWHYIESPYEETISVNFWARCGPTRNPEIPLKNVMQRMALRRNIEKLAGQSIGYEESTRMFEKIGKGAALTPKEEATRDQILPLLSQVLDRSEVESFLIELSTSRFDLPRAEAVSSKKKAPVRSTSPMSGMTLETLAAAGASAKGAMPLPGKR